MTSRRWMVCFLFAAVLAAQDTALQISGDVKRPMGFTAAELARMPQSKYQFNDGDKEVVYEGVAIAEVLQKAGAINGELLKGKALSSYLIATGLDGYQVLFSLPELDPFFTDHTPLIALRMDGKPLASKDGPLKLLIPNDKAFPRWVRQLVKLELVQLKK
jgi:DMSO/TMAO reductase YedYZ molybdopterin-dependent catalytic subunit